MKKTVLFSLFLFLIVYSIAQEEEESGIVIQSEISTFHFSLVEEDPYLNYSIQSINTTQVTFTLDKKAEPPPDWKWGLVICNVSGFNDMSMESEQLGGGVFTPNYGRYKGMNKNWCNITDKNGFIGVNSMPHALLPMTFTFYFPENATNFRIHAGAGTITIDATVSSGATEYVSSNNLIRTDDGMCHVVFINNGDELMHIYTNSTNCNSASVWTQEEISNGNYKDGNIVDLGGGRLMAYAQDLDIIPFPYAKFIYNTTHWIANGSFRDCDANRAAYVASCKSDLKNNTYCTWICNNVASDEPMFEKNDEGAYKLYDGAPFYTENFDSADLDIYEDGRVAVVYSERSTINKVFIKVSNTTGQFTNPPVLLMNHTSSNGLSTTNGFNTAIKMIEDNLFVVTISNETRWISSRCTLGFAKIDYWNNTSKWTYNYGNVCKSLDGLNPVFNYWADITGNNHELVVSYQDSTTIPDAQADVYYSACNISNNPESSSCWYDTTIDTNNEYYVSLMDSNGIMKNPLGFVWTEKTKTSANLKYNEITLYNSTCDCSDIFSDCTIEEHCQWDSLERNFTGTLNITSTGRLNLSGYSNISARYYDVIGDVWFSELWNDSSNIVIKDE